MRAFNIKNAIISGVAGIFIFALLLKWSPLTGIQLQDVGAKETKTRQVKKIDGKLLTELQGVLSGTSSELSEKGMNGEATMVKICATYPKFRQNTVGYEAVKNRIAEESLKKGKERLLLTFEALENFVDEKCENGKPKP